MKELKVYVLFLLLVLMYSCNNLEPKGMWDDTIHLSTKSADFKASGDSVIVKTEGTAWWVSCVSVNGSHYLDTTKNDRLTKTYTFKQNCFMVQRLDKNTLFIKLDANPLDAIRVVTVELEAGDYFDRVTVTQHAK